MNSKLAKWEAWIAIVGNILLFLYKFYVARLIGSAAVAADAWHTLSDSLSSLVLLIGIRIADRPPDKEHPYGHGRAELIAALLIGTMLAALGLEFLGAGIEKLTHHESVVYGKAAIIAMVATVVVKEAMAQFAFWASRRTGMISLAADAHHHRSDAISSIIILAGILVGSSFWWLDGVLTLIVTGFIFQAAWRTLADASTQILGREPDKKFVADLETICRERLGNDVGVHHVHLHSYGAHREVTFHILLPGNCSLEQAHEASRRVESDVRRILGCRATIHVEPLENPD